MVAKVLERPTLVLNRNWQPINVATVERALVMLWNESARVVDPHDYRLYDWADWSQLWPAEGELFVQAVRLRLGPAKRTAIDVCAIFWHFLDALWIMLMAIFYLWA